MNKILELKGKRFIQESKRNNGGGASMNSHKIVTCDQLVALKNRLDELKIFWKKEEKFFDGILISVYYNKIVAKTNRIGGLFRGKNSNYAIVGAKFNQEKTKHIITYYLDIKDLDKSIDLLNKAEKVLGSIFDGHIDHEVFKNKKKMESIGTETFQISKSLFKQIIADVSYIDDFGIEMETRQLTQSIITLYKTDTDVQEMLKNIGIHIMKNRILDSQTIFLDRDELQILLQKAPYLVSMATEDLMQLSPEDFIKEYKQETLYMPKPTIEPTIGVIDTLFDERVYFGEWVEYHDMVNNEIPKGANDYRHGTAVTSIIVDGPRLNPWLDDGCGRFRVRHFGVAVGRQFSSFTITKLIKEIVVNNKDIKVWNISLGSNQEINDNFISAEAAVLDKIQYENDVIFVIAGTNKPNENIQKIGSPADSINSIVVNAVTKRGLSTKYTRRGLALSFFAKPDISYYGGSEEQYIKVCEPLGEANVVGTSFAAPWIARKMSYLIDVLGLNREVAKALLIDSARGWEENPTPEKVAVYGHGIVPIKIEDIIKTKEDEIKFLVYDVSEKWNTYNYHFPVPLKDEKYPYVAKATMCYFPKCDRTQGVDYTNTELNLHFGRIKDNGKIEDIKGDMQNQDNVKYIVERPKTRKIPKKSYRNKNWGMEIKTNNRLNPKDGEGIRFGVVVTLKEMNGINRIDEFIKNCILNGWLVNEVDVDTRIEINQKVNEEIEFD